MPAGSTYEPIATTTLGSATGSYTFSSIPGTYTDLIIDLTGTSTAAVNVALRFNGNNTGTSYSWTTLNNRSESPGTAVVSARTANVSYLYANQYTAFTTNAIAQSKINIMNYSNTTTNKTLLIRSATAPGNTTFSGNEVIVGMWRNTNAITSVQIIADGSTFAAGSIFTIYGITAA